MLPTAANRVSSRVVATTAPVRHLTRKTFAVWTAIMTAILAVWTWGVVHRSVGPIGFSYGFLPGVIAIIVLSWGGWFERLLPAVLATALVGLWPLYSWLVSGETRTATAFFVAAGVINGMMLLTTVLGFADRRGWLNQSPIRRRLNVGLMMLLLVSSMVDWPTGGWRRVMTATWFGAFLLTLFWPMRKKAPRPRGPVTV
jgi:hypothetical protein